MKAKIYIVVLLAIFMLSSCLPERGDWSFEGLPKGFIVNRINGRTIWLESKTAIVIDSYVSEIAYNDTYIFAKQVAVPEDLDIKIDTSNPVYYIVVVKTEELYGPYSLDEFNDKCSELEIDELPEWIVTTKLKYHEETKR